MLWSLHSGVWAMNFCMLPFFSILLPRFSKPVCSFVSCGLGFRDMHMDGRGEIRRGEKNKKEIGEERTSPACKWSKLLLSETCFCLDGILLFKRGRWELHKYCTDEEELQSPHDLYTHLFSSLPPLIPQPQTGKEGKL